MFPFHLPPPTAFYLSLYLGTLVLHVLPMAYVVAGSAILMTRVIVQPRLIDDPLTTHLRQWLPFVLSAAITAGVAPLLFLQILYQREFYTANLLLFHRWMAILPVLIVGFYLLYLLKGNWLWRRPFVVRSAVVTVVFGCFVFVGWSWSENHLLSLASQDTWSMHYADGKLNYWPGELVPRMGIWLGEVFPVMAALVAWPLASQTPSPGVARRLATVAIAGMAVSLACGVWYFGLLEPPARELVTSNPWRAWMAVAIAGFAFQVVASALIWRSDSLSTRSRWLALLGAVLSVAGIVACREAVRISRLDFEALYPRHAAALKIDGFWLFAVFLVLNAIAIGLCIAVVARNLVPPRDEPARQDVR